MESERKHLTHEELLQTLDIFPEMLDYWVREFGGCGLVPQDDGTFDPKAVAVAFFVRRLLQEEGFTLWGARRRLLAWDPESGSIDSERGTPETDSALELAGRQIRELLVLLDDALQ